MDGLLQLHSASVVLRLDAVPPGSPLALVSQLLSASLGLGRYAAAIHRPVSDIRVVPVLATLLLSRDNGSSWAGVDVEQQLQRVWDVRRESKPATR
jgi:hypothetical protein